MKRGQSAGTGAPEIVDLNLLPANQRPAQVSLAMAVVVVGLIVAIFAIAPLALRLGREKDRASAASQQANAAEQGLHGVQVDLAQHNALQNELAATRSKLDAFHTERAQFQGGGRSLVDDLTQLARPDRLPAGARLKTVAGTDTGLRVEGTAPGPLDAIAYADQLTKDAGFSGARLISFAPAGLGGQFVIEVTR